MSTKCAKCRKEIKYRQEECDASGLAWHLYCFRCYICGALLNEKCVNIRGDEKDRKLYCGMHVVYQEGYQPVCKVYCLQNTFRVVF